MNTLTLHVIIFILSAGGFLIAEHIHKSKIGKKPLICPKKMPCDDVVKSEHSQFLGMGVEKIGKSYYLAMAVINLLLIVAPGFGSATLNSILVFVSLLALLFSIYLLIIQTHVIKKFCAWCLASLVISLLIFVFVFLL